MPRIDWVEARLVNWARWKLGRSEGGISFSRAQPGVLRGGSGYATASVPILDAEAADTDDAVMQLYPGGLRLTVIEVYCGRGGMDDHARELACSVSTIHARIVQAHEQLAEHWRARREKAEAERQRVEQLQRRGF